MAGLESCDDARLYAKSYVGVGQSYVNARLHQRHDITYAWWCIFVKKCNFRMFTKYSLETTHSLVLNVVVIVSSHFILFWYVWVIISIWINQQNISDNKNQLSISNQTVSEKTLLPWMCEIWKMLIIAKSVCEIKIDHQTDNQFLFPTIVLIKATKLDHPKLTFW